MENIQYFFFSFFCSGQQWTTTVVSNYQIERKKNNKPEKEASSFVRQGVLGLILGKGGKGQEGSGK